MKAYVLTTGTLFGALGLAHILRVIAEAPHWAKDPWYLLITVIAAGLCLWACLLLRPKRS